MAEPLPSYETPVTSEGPPSAGAPGVHRTPGTNGYAIASLILGILGLMWFPPVIPSFLALIFGYMGKREIDRSGGMQQGRGLAVAGIVLGWVGVLMLVIALAFLVFAVAGGILSSSVDLFRFSR